MISLVLLVCVVSAAMAASSSSSESVSGLLERLAEGKKLIFDLDENNPQTSEDDDDDDVLTSEASSSSLEALERQLRQDEKDKRLNNRLDGAAKAALVRGSRNAAAGTIRESYQAVFTCTECATNNVALGPVVLIAKTTSAPAQDDHFDQNPAGPDGFDDVKFALNRWQETSVIATRAQRIEDFLIQVRNRATVNGGSIGLQALILTGKQKLANGRDSTTDATFGGTAGRVLITPCLPVINDIPLFNLDNPLFEDGEVEKLSSNGGYNVQVVGSVVNQRALFEINNAAASVPLTAFFDINANEFLPETASFGLKVFVDDDDDATDNTVIGLEDTFGSVKFERCTRFSYFQ